MYPAISGGLVSTTIPKKTQGQPRQRRHWSLLGEQPGEKTKEKREENTF